MKIEYVPASEFCESVRDGTHDTPKQVEIGFKLVTGKCIKNGKIELNEAYYISEQDYKKICERSKVDKWDVLMGMIGTLGRSAVVKEEADYAIKNLALFKLGNPIKAKWLHYYLSSSLGQNIIFNTLQGSSQQFISLRLLRTFPIPKVDDNVMLRVVSILSDFDDLIENNQKQIKLLEEAAQRLYKEWFVDLRFPGHENVKIVDGVPEGWENTILDEVIEFNPSISLSKERIKECVPMAALSTSEMTLDINEISYSKSNSGSRFQNNDTIMARITPCLENGKIAFVQELQSEEGAVGSTEYIVMRSKSLCPPMVYLLARTHNFRQYAINSMSGSDGRQRVKVERLREYEYLKPDATLIEKFSGNVTPFFKKIKDLSKANIVLQEARDRLLPKLMSGEIEV